MKERGTWGYHWYSSQFFNKDKKGIKPCLGCNTGGHWLFKENCPDILGTHGHNFMCEAKCQ